MKDVLIYFFKRGCCETLVKLKQHHFSASDTSHSSCVVVSLTTGKWKMADCLGRYAFPCKYPAIFDTSTTPETNETEPGLSPPLPINIILDLKNLPNYTGLFLWIFVILILIFGCLQCLFYQCIQCMKNIKISQPRRSSTNNNSNPCQERMRRRSNPSHGRMNSFGSYLSNSASGQYSPDPSEEAARLLESQEELRARSSSMFSNRNWIPATTINAQIQQNNNSPPRSVIITIPPQPSQIPQTMNTEEFVSLHGNYSNYPSLPRSEISSILEQLSSGNYIPRENRPWDLPPQYPIYYRTEGDEEIGVSLCRNMPQLLPPPPYSDFNVTQPAMPMPPVNLHNNRLPHNTTIVPTPLTQSLIHPPQRVNDSLSSARILGIPVLPPAFENGIFANQVRRSQNRRNRLFNEENERLFKKRV